MSRLCEGEKNYFYESGKIERTCPQCGDTFETWTSQTDKFCDRVCYGEYRSENYTGPNSGCWRGGGDFREAVMYSLPGTPWQTQRKKNWESEDNCELCGGVQEDRNLATHHIIPVLAGGVNDEDLLMPLCTGCHHTVESYTRELLDYPLLPD